MKRIIIVTLMIILNLFLNSCASFQQDLVNPNPLFENNLNELNGEYQIFDIKASVLKEKKWNVNFLKEIDREIIKDIFRKGTLKLDTLKTYSFELKVLNEKRIKICYIENNKVFKEKIIRTKLKKDGYLYLKNKNTIPLLLPYIFGSIDINKTRLTKSENGDLIFDVVNFRGGAFLLIIGVGGTTDRYRNTYKSE